MEAEIKEVSKKKTLIFIGVIVVLTSFLLVWAFYGADFKESYDKINVDYQDGINNLPSLVTIGTEEGNQQWTVTKSTGWEGDNFYVWFSDLKDKKTQICLVAKNENQLTSTPDLKLYDENNNPILDNKNKDIILKYESSKCDGMNGYTITLTDAQAININDYIKFGNNSIAITYQNISRVSYDGGWFNLNATLYINLDGNFTNTINNIFVFNDGNKNKFGANVTGFEGNQQFKYILEADKPVIKKNEFNYYIEGEEVNDGLTKTKEVHDISLEDICELKFIETGGTMIIPEGEVPAGYVFNPNCSITQSSPNELEITFYAEELNGTINVDPSITIDGTTSYTSTDVNVTQETGYAHANISTSPPYDQLVLYTPFDLNKVDDYTGKNTLAKNGVIYTHGYFNGSYSYSGSYNDYIYSTSTTADVTGGQMSAFAWINASYIDDSANGNLIVSKYDTTGSNRVFAFGINNWAPDGISNTPFIYLGLTDGTFGYKGRASTNDLITTGEWYHVGFTKDGTNLTFYVNGQAYSATDIAGSVPATSKSCDENWRIGYAVAGGYIGGFKGRIDEVMVFNNSLSSSQVQDIYNNQSARFVNEGTQTFSSQNLSEGTNTANVTLENSLSFFDSNLSVSINGGTEVNFSKGVANNVPYTGSSTSASVVIKYFSGVTRFYSPLVIGNITIDSWIGAGGDSVYPVFYNYTDNNASLTDTGLGTFSVNVNDTNGTVILHIDGNDILASNTSNWFNVSYSFSSAGDYAYNWTSYGNGTSNNLNTSATRIYTVNATAVDTDYPVFSNYLTSPDNNTEYVEGASYEFNVTITSTNGTAGIEFDGVNYSLSNLSEVYHTVLSDLGAKTYSYYYWAYGNGTDNLYNVSTIKSYTIAKNSSYTLGITGTTPITYGTVTDVSGNSCPSQLSCSLDKPNQVYGVGTETFNYSTSGNENYTGNSITKDIVINQANSETSLTFDKTSPQIYPEPITPTCSVTTGEGSASLNIGTSGSPIVLGAGSYDFNCSLAETQNYTASENVSNFVINKNQTSLGLTATTPITYGTVTDFAGSGCNSEISCSLNISNGIYSAGTISANYSTSGNENYSGSSAVFTVTINKASSVVNMFLDNAQSDKAITKDSIIDINASLTTGEGDIQILEDGIIFNSGSSPLYNSTNFTSVGYYNFTAYYPATENYTTDSETFFLNVSLSADTTNPSVTNLLETPTNSTEYNPVQTYYFNSTITDDRTLDTVLLEFNGVNYSASQLGNVFTKTLNNLGAGVYDYRWYANDTSGNVNNSETGSYTINKNNSYVLSISGTSPINYGTTTDVSGSGCPSQLSCDLDKANAVYGAGTEVFNYSTVGNANYTGNSTTISITINKITPNVVLRLNGASANKTVNNVTSVTLLATANNDQNDIYLYANNSLFNMGKTSISNITTFPIPFLYNITAIYPESENYSNDFQTWWLNVTEYIASNGTSTVTQTPICHYKKFGFYNLRLPWIREENCI